MPFCRQIVRSQIAYLLFMTATVFVVKGNIILEITVSLFTAKGKYNKNLIEFNESCHPMWQVRDI